MCISLKFCTRRGQVLSLSVCLSLCRSDLLFFERMRVPSPGYLSLDPFFVGKILRAHTHSFGCVFCRKKGGSTQPSVFFFKKTPKFACFWPTHTRRSASFGPEGNKIQKKDPDGLTICARDDATLFFLFFLSFFLSSFPHAQK